MKTYPFALMAKLGVALIIAQTTEFVPDEYWQSTEVAYHWTFGKGHLTWEWTAGLRSYILPGLIALMYKVALILGLGHSPAFLSALPHGFQAWLSYIGYRCFSWFVRRRLGSPVVPWANTLLLFNWFTTFCCARLLSNQTELSLNCIGLYLLEREKFVAFTFVVALNFVIRPTAAILWLPFVFELIFKIWPKGMRVVIRCAVVAMCILAVGIFVDTMMYGKTVVSWWQFFRFNFVDSGNAEFGVHHPLWYFYSGLPSIFGPAVILLPCGLFIAGETRALTVYLGSYVAIYSFLDHKEIRFLLPAVPLGIAILASVLSKLDVLCESKFGRSNPAKYNFRNIPFVIFMILNVGATAFFGLFHQCGTKSATHFIRQNMEYMENPRVWLLMPCYSVPVHTYLHHPTAQFEYYICAPPQFRDIYANRSDAPLIQPNGFATVSLKNDIARKVKDVGPPDFIMAYDQSLSTIERSFNNTGVYYRTCAKYKHSYIGDFSRYVTVLCKHNEKVSEFKKRADG